MSNKKFVSNNTLQDDYQLLVKKNKGKVIPL